MTPKRVLLGLSLSLLTASAMAAADPACAEDQRLRSERDKALKAKDFKAYCGALDGLIRRMPAKAPDPAQLRCEAQASQVSLNTWIGMRPDVLETMTSTFDQHCR